MRKKFGGYPKSFKLPPLEEQVATVNKLLGLNVPFKLYKKVTDELKSEGYSDTPGKK